MRRRRGPSCAGSRVALVIVARGSHAAQTPQAPGPLRPQAPSPASTRPAGRPQVPGLAQGLRALRGRRANGLPRRRGLRLRRLLPLRRGERRARGAAARRGARRLLRRLDHRHLVAARATAASFPGKPYVNRGIGGQTTAQMLLRFRADVLGSQAEGGRDPGRAPTTSPATPAPSRSTRSRTTSPPWPSWREAHGIRVVLASLLPVSDDKQDARPAADAHHGPPDRDAPRARTAGSRPTPRRTATSTSTTSRPWPTQGPAPARAQRRRPAPERPRLRGDGPARREGDRRGAAQAPPKR